MEQPAQSVTFIEGLQLGSLQVENLLGLTVIRPNISVMESPILRETHDHRVIVRIEIYKLYEGSSAALYMFDCLKHGINIPQVHPELGKIVYRQTTA